MGATNIQVVTGSDAFILTNPPSRSRSRVPRRTPSEGRLNIPNPSGKEFRLTISIFFQEYLFQEDREPRPAGKLWSQYNLGTATAKLPFIEASVPVENPNPNSNHFLIVTRGEVLVHYAGQASMHVWLSYYAEVPEVPS